MCQFDLYTFLFLILILNLIFTIYLVIQIPEIFKHLKELRQQLSRLEVPGIKAEDVMQPTAAKELPPPLPPVLKQKQAASTKAALPENKVKSSPDSSKWRKFRNWFIFGTGNEVAPECREKQFAATWLLRAGILVLLCTAGFLLHLSIAKGIMGVNGRLVTCIISGIALLLWSMKLIKTRYSILGQALQGLSIAIFYITVFAACSLYELLPAGVGYALIALLTILSSGLALKYNFGSIATVALIGGYTAPIIINIGIQGILFGYVLLLSCGVLWLSWKRNWLPLNWLGMLFTYYIVNSRDFHSIVVLCIFAVLYSMVTIIRNLSGREKSTVLEIVGLTANVCLFFVSSSAILWENAFPNRALGFISIGIAVYYIVHSWYLFRKREDDEQLKLTCMGISGAALAVSVPLFLSQDWVMTGWSLLALLLVGLGCRIKSSFLRGAGYALFTFITIWVISIDLLENWEKEPGYLFQMMKRVFNILVPVAALGAAAKLAERTKQNWFIPKKFEKPELDTEIQLISKATVISWGCFFIYSTRELWEMLSAYIPVLRHGGISVFWCIFAAALIYQGLREVNRRKRYLGLALFTVTVSKIFFIDLATLSSLYRVGAFLIFGLLLMGSAFLYLKLWKTEK